MTHGEVTRAEASSAHVPTRRSLSPARRRSRLPRSIVAWIVHLGANGRLPRGISFVSPHSARAPARKRAKTRCGGDVQVAEARRLHPDQPVVLEIAHLRDNGRSGGRARSVERVCLPVVHTNRSAADHALVVAEIQSDVGWIEDLARVRGWWRIDPHLVGVRSALEIFCELENRRHR